MTGIRYFGAEHERHPWWLRSPASNAFQNNWTMVVGLVGYKNYSDSVYYGGKNAHEYLGVRPAIWLDISDEEN